MNEFLIRNIVKEELLNEIFAPTAIFNLFNLKSSEGIVYNDKKLLTTEAKVINDTIERLIYLYFEATERSRKDSRVINVVRKVLKDYLFIEEIDKSSDGLVVTTKYTTTWNKNPEELDALLAKTSTAEIFKIIQKEHFDYFNKNVKKSLTKKITGEEVNSILSRIAEAPYEAGFFEGILHSTSGVYYLVADEHLKKAIELENLSAEDMESLLSLNREEAGLAAIGIPGSIGIASAGGKAAVDMANFTKEVQAGTKKAINLANLKGKKFKAAMKATKTGFGYLKHAAQRAVLVWASTFILSAGIIFSRGSIKKFEIDNFIEQCQDIIAALINDEIKKISDKINEIEDSADEYDIGNYLREILNSINIESITKSIENLNNKLSNFDGPYNTSDFAGGAPMINNLFLIDNFLNTFFPKSVDVEIGDKSLTLYQLEGFEKIVFDDKGFFAKAIENLVVGFVSNYAMEIISIKIGIKLIIQDIANVAKGIEDVDDIYLEYRKEKNKEIKKREEK